tara:strand:- start:409 stop:1395 length:987 start_codon:yes stop_codon:yes gene_type:complete
MSSTQPKKPKKRGRKSKKEKEAMLKAQQESNNVIVEKKPKKRGRKPKGGKIIKAENLNSKVNEKQNPNIILHLKCQSKDLNKFDKCALLNNNLKLETLDINNNNKLDYFELNSKEENVKKKNIDKNNVNDNNDKNENINMKLIHEKVKKLKVNLRHNNVLYKRASCFWCTYEFDSPAIFIPRSQKNETIEVYGCFCSPECACSFLKNEKIDDSTRWERYNMLNNLYCKIYNYEKNIKPAPSPYYTLDKYYGNLTIEEYRKLLKNERLMMVVDKPLTKILPELFEENNEIPNIFGNLLNKKKETTVKYRLQRNEPISSKKSMLSTNFNF